MRIDVHTHFLCLDFVKHLQGRSSLPTTVLDGGVYVMQCAAGLRLPTAVLFDHPTAEELADHLHGLLVADAAVGEHQVMSALELWDAASSPDSVGEAARARVAARLRLLADKWDDTAGTGSHGDLEAATAEEIFDLIAAEFGKS